MPHKDLVKRRAYQLAWQLRRRKLWLEENGPCVNCGSWDQLEVDHVDATTKVTHRVWSWSLERRTNELAKCVVRCHSCHVLKTRLAGEKAQGSSNGRARLTRLQVTRIRELHSAGYTYKDLGSQFNVHLTTIQQICQRRIWKNVP